MDKKVRRRETLLRTIGTYFRREGTKENMENVDGSSQPVRPRPKAHRSLGWFLAGVILIVILLVFYICPQSIPDGSNVVIPSPANCMLTTNAPAAESVKYLENVKALILVIFFPRHKAEPGKPASFG